MDLGFVQARIQTTIMIDTTHELIAMMERFEITSTHAIALLLAGIVSLYNLPVAEQHQVLVNLVELFTIASVTILTSTIQNMFPDLSNTRQLIEYTILAVTVISTIKTIPKEISSTMLLSRLRFTFVLTTAGYYTQQFTSNSTAIALTAICTAIVVVKHQDWFAEKKKLPIALRAVFSIGRYFVLDFAISVLVLSDVPGGVQNLIYCVALVLVMGFITTAFGNSTKWRGFALWRVADLVTANLQQRLGISQLTVATSLLALYMLLSILQYKFRETGSLFIDLLRFVMASNITRVLISFSQNLPVSDLIMLRFFIVLLFVG